MEIIGVQPAAKSSRIRFRPALASALETWPLPVRDFYLVKTARSGGVHRPNRPVGMETKNWPLRIAKNNKRYLTQRNVLLAPDIPACFAGAALTFVK